MFPKVLILDSLKTMKTFLTLFVLLFSSSVFAEDISDFEIEGMNVGDSLLDYFSEEEIKDNLQINQFPKSNKYILVSIKDHQSFKTYEMVGFVYKNNDKDYIIQHIFGNIFYENDLNNCFKKKKEIKEYFLNNFSSFKLDEFEELHPADKSKKSIQYKSNFEFASGEAIQIACMDWSKEMDNRMFDSLAVSIFTKEFISFLQEAY